MQVPCPGQELKRTGDGAEGQGFQATSCLYSTSWKILVKHMLFLVTLDGQDNPKSQQWAGILQKSHFPQILRVHLGAGEIPREAFLAMKNWVMGANADA